ncbi:prepilin-type N-terminal cleavage/methylation domain-containing protein [Oxynema sp. CENA135]|uniref:GspH/FimT family pseudopilin n=1 Tax=Oxynema sp. CENA135 TaxID=984206 RepID=UPI00190B4737|nr:GspH/FimT family pseudopilin [Oxynema sp. CENA135]MBK4732774.1 prepilin-type N-terminal cleavage/methylation domain-containing protein [Oxynema sp. CENA135]
MNLVARFQRSRGRSHLDGFTLLEVLLVTISLGILAAIALPSWLSLVENTRLNNAQNEIYMAMRQAQRKAKQRKSTYQVSFRQNDTIAQWVIHKKDTVPPESTWNNLDPTIQIDADETTLYQNNTTGDWRVQFNHKGHTNGQLGRITVSPIKNGGKKRCVFASTLLGALRKARENPKPKNGRYCY